MSELAVNGNLRLGWSALTDSIKVDNYDRGNVSIADGQFLKDENGNKVTPPQYIWTAQESIADGISVEPNGDVSFTKEGGFNVQLRSPDGTIIYSPWIPVHAYRGGDDGLSDSVDKSSPTVISTENNVPKTGDTSSSACVAAVLLTSLTAVLFLAVKRRKKE